MNFIIFELFNKTLVYKSKSSNNSLCLLGCGGPSEVVKANVEPFIDITVEFVVFITDLLWGEALFHCLGLRGCPVLISTTDVQGVVVPQPAESIIMVY